MGTLFVRLPAFEIVFYCKQAKTEILMHLIMKEELSRYPKIVDLSRFNVIANSEVYQLSSNFN